MARSETKLRPSISWADMTLAIKALDITIKQAVAANKVKVEHVRMSDLKEYLESFAPTEQVISTKSIQSLMLKYGADTVIEPTALESDSVSTPSIADKLQAKVAAQIEEIDDTPLTDEQRYDVLKLRDSSTYNEEEVKFMANTGTMIMILRAAKTNVGANDL